MAHTDPSVRRVMIAATLGDDRLLEHLLSKTAVHMNLRFDEGVKVTGPHAIGAGRHCGFGLFASIAE